MATLQIDAINTVIRSHYMPVYSRLGPYDRQALDSRMFHPRGQTAGKRTFFEYWGHECSLMSMDLYPLFRWRMDDAKRGVGVYKQLHHLACSKPGYVDGMLREIAQRGPSTSRELSTSGRGKGMWEWSESKQALEYLFWTGDISSAGRRGFERLYAATEHAIPDEVLSKATVPKPDAQADLIEIAARALGVASETDLRDYFRIPAIDTTSAIARLLEDRRLIPITVEKWAKTAYVCPDTKIPRVGGATALLTPFDPLVWHRDRTERLFDFHYRIEIYVPEAKRKYGYYVLPFLVDDTMAARVDLKADRDSSRLVVLGAWTEDNVTVTDLAEKLAAELCTLQRWLNLERVEIQRRGDLASRLRRCMH